MGTANDTQQTIIICKRNRFLFLFCVRMEFAPSYTSASPLRIDSNSCILVNREKANWTRVNEVRADTLFRNTFKYSRYSRVLQTNAMHKKMEKMWCVFHIFFFSSFLCPAFDSVRSRSCEIPQWHQLRARTWNDYDTLTLATTQ